MVTTITNTQPGISESVWLVPEQEEPAIPCFFCGVCCTKYRVKISLAEARRICEGLGLNWYIFLSNYIEPSSDGIDSFCLRQQDGACIFLKKRGGEHQQYVCLIHTWKPAACRELNASLHRKECQAGLLKYWRLVVTPQGRLCGPDDKIKSFQAFLITLKRNKVPVDSIWKEGILAHG